MADALPLLPLLPRIPPLPRQPRHAAIFQALGDQLQASVGHTLFTVSYYLPGGTEVERIFTSLPAAYPNGGRKPVHPTEWNDTMATGACFVASAPAQFGAHFEDLDTIVALGFGAVINIPVIHQGRLVGSLNLLDQEGAYRGNVLPACLVAGELAVEGFIAYEKFSSTQSA